MVEQQFPPYKKTWNLKLVNFLELKERPYWLGR